MIGRSYFLVLATRPTDDTEPGPKTIGNLFEVFQGEEEPCSQGRSKDKVGSSSRTQNQVFPDKGQVLGRNKGPLGPPATEMFDAV